MFNDFLIEDYNLLEFTNFELNQQLQFNYTDNIMTESDMIIAVYENQIFMEQQNREIFSYLEYGYVQEGVIDKAFNAIKGFFKKIKELIMKFINWISSKFKKKNKAETEINANEVKNIEKDINDIKNKTKNIEKKVEIDNSESYEKIKSDIERLEEKFKNSTLRDCVIGNNARSYLKEVSKEGGGLDFDDGYYVNAFINRLKRNSKKGNDRDVNYYNIEMEDIKKETEELIAALKDVYINKEEIPMNNYEHQLVDIEPYYKKYYKSIPYWVKALQDVINKYINPAEAKFNSIKLLDKETDSENTKLISMITRFINVYYSLISKQIQFLVKLENVFSVYESNVREFNKISNEIKELKNKLSKLSI